MTLTPADTAFLDKLRPQLPEGTLRAPEPRYLEEPRGRYNGQAAAIAMPRTTQEVATLVRAAHDARVAVVPYGGGTGLVGGQIMEADGPLPLVISLERMTALRGIYPQENVMTVEAGMVLADVQAAAQEAGRLFPLSLAAEGTARIGGTLATNAGGVNVLRYGNARDLCLGQAVLPNGEIWHGLSRLRKDNTGYDLRNLLIGAEGTLGIITAAALKLSAIPAEQGTAILSVSSPAAAIDLLALARDQLGETISAFELIHRQGLAFLRETLPDLRLPFDDLPEWCVLVDLGLPKGRAPQDELAALFEGAYEAGLSDDGVIAQSEAQREALWAVREHIPEANRRIGSVSSHDISIPISRIPEFIVEGGKRIAALGDLRINCFGHLGDGNLHYNVFPAQGKDRSAYEHLRSDVKRTVHDLTHEMQGSVSAEHGVGRLKVGDLERYGDPVKLAAMQAIKQALDPHGIMNPGAVVPAGR